MIIQGNHSGNNYLNSMIWVKNENSTGATMYCVYSRFYTYKGKWRGKSCYNRIHYIIGTYLMYNVYIFTDLIVVY